MNSNSASDDPDPGHGFGRGADGGCGPVASTAGGAGRVARWPVPSVALGVWPSAGGVAPSRGEVDGIDWSGGGEAAAVGRLLESALMVDRWRIEQVEALVQVVELGAAEQVLGVAVEVVLSQSRRIAREEARRLLRAAHTWGGMPAVRHGFREGWLSWS